MGKLAVFLVDATYSEDGAAIPFPYEYLPLPKEGDEVRAVNRKGKVVCRGKVIKLRNPKSYDHTPLASITVPKKHICEVRGMKLLEEDVR